MRIDKFLKNSRILKRRSVAKKACDDKRILVNGKAAKAGKDVQIGDKITIIFGNNEMTYEIIDIAEHVPKEKAAELYRIIS